MLPKLWRGDTVDLAMGEVELAVGEVEHIGYDFKRHGDRGLNANCVLRCCFGCGSIINKGLGFPGAVLDESVKDQKTQ
jgi:hypothetical protein